MHHADRNVRAGSDALQRIAGSTGGSAKFNSTRSDNMAAKKGRKAAKKGGAKKGGRKAAKKGGAKKGGRKAAKKRR